MASPRAPGRFVEQCQARGARELGESMLRALPEDSVLFADYSLWSIMRYLQEIEGQRADVTLVELPGVGAGAQIDLIRKRLNEIQPTASD